ncbi:substrate carrier family protein [Medicago truncatula]|uniref:Substrate carrier family protein n=2 Tax=Medicago truncatula TaxID=3880 RepID=I3S3R1_MEDTR|nr:unknown [Medicago truncatula]KEH20834.1 substrate carrier family protein [Medicago truncatula]
MSHLIQHNDDSFFFPGGLFLHADTVPTSFITCIPSSSSNSTTVSCFSCNIRKRVGFQILRVQGGAVFSSLSLSINGRSDDVDHRYKSNQKEEKENIHVHGSGAVNMTKHLWSGAFAAMVSRTFVAPLERLKLEYIVRGEQKNLFELIQTIATSQGLKGFWKGNFVNILRTAPFKAINFYAYDTYKNKLVRLSGNEESTNFERFVAGAAAGVTATLLCLPMDTIRTVMVAPGGEALGGVIGVFRHMIKTEGFFSLYKGLVPSIISMAPSGAVYYGVYDILKSAYLHSPEGMKRLRYMKEEGQELNALEQLELGTIRTLLYGAIAGCCSEAATYPFEVVRRQLQLQVRATRLNALATCVKIVEQGGVPALYAGLTPSLLQVLPSAAISYFVYEFMKIVLKVEST